MNRIKKTFVKILRKKIYLKGKEVPVIIKDYPIDKTPCITIDGMNRDYGRRRRQQITVMYPLQKSHPLYDENHPHRKYPHVAEYVVKDYEVYIHVWCNTEEERELIVDQIYDSLFFCMNNHHHYCTRYNHKTKICSTTGEECMALYDKGYHGLRGQCPNTKKYRFENILTANNILMYSVHISPHYEDDDLDEREPLKHSVIEIPLKYQRIKVHRSNPVLSIEYRNKYKPKDKYHSIIDKFKRY